MLIFTQRFCILKYRIINGLIKYTSFVLARLVLLVRNLSHFYFFHNPEGTSLI